MAHGHPTLDEVLINGNTTDRDIHAKNARLTGDLRQNGNVLGFGRIPSFPGNAIELQYFPDPNFPELRLVPRGPNPEKTRMILQMLGRGLWIFENGSGAPLITTSSNGLHCRLNLTAHQSVAGRQYVESTEGFVKAATFLDSQGGILRWLGEEPTRPQVWWDSDWLEDVFNTDTLGHAENAGAANLRAGNVVSSKAAFYYNQNLMNAGEGIKSVGNYNVHTIEMPCLPIGDFSYFKVTYERPIKDPVVVVTPWADSLSNGDVIAGVEPGPTFASIVRSRPEFFEVRIWNALCTPKPISSKNYGFNIFNDIGFHFHASSRLLVNGQ